MNKLTNNHQTFMFKVFTVLSCCFLLIGCAQLNTLYTDVDELPGNRLKILSKGSWDSTSRVEIVESTAEKRCGGAYEVISTDFEVKPGGAIGKNLVAIVQCEGQIGQNTRITNSTKKAPVDRAVINAQRKLNDLGYDAGSADGILGQGTKSAIKQFQIDNDLEINSLLDRETSALLGI
ncbi:peptidoglycan-binding domain-containing protein [Granulosicoccus antarcticus]|uniref:Peptidoglycan binding-like domain-containing protein n=1 Tax=Granulosicoccus antarcticus IMCC3135 TaxID=1192854 RepID=A0A2Z2NRY4_9GAMM|nr:peptidoglycan-binding domain-containing protein [Granulosicoccus antarcticus]ASJ70307.1 hypothetical protein IMCC3135_00905 [Granulosicoccus antarcticus IMCC3135]